MTVEPYAVRQLQVTFQLGTGSFGAAGLQTLTLPAGMRAEVHIELATLPSTGTLALRLYGMTLDHMNQISQAGLLYQGRRNLVQVKAGDTISGMVTIFSGLIIEAYPDMNAQPETSFYVFATPTNELQLKPTPPVTFASGTPGATALTSILQPAGVKLENNGVSGVLSTPYFAGSTWDQVKACVRALGCFAHYDGVANTLSIWPQTGNRAGSPTLIAPETGMIGYPVFQQLQVKTRVLFDPTLGSLMGKQVKIQSSLRAANGLFNVVYLAADLAAQTVGGPWEMVITAVPPPNPTAIPVSAPAQ